MLKRLRSLRRLEHVGCKDPYCLKKLGIEVWLNEDDLMDGETCCGCCGCCPCHSVFCHECRYNKPVFKQINWISWKLWGERRWQKYLRSLEK